MPLVDMRSRCKRTASAGFGDSPNSLLFSPDGKTIVSANDDGTLTLWDAPRRVADETLRGHSNGDAAAGLQRGREDALHGERRTGRRSPGTSTVDRRRRAACSPSRTTATSSRRTTATRGGSAPTVRLIAVGLKEDGVALLDARDLTPAGAALRGRPSGEVKALAFAPDGRTLAAVTGNGQMTVWDLPSRSRRGEHDLRRRLSRGGWRSARTGGRIATTGRRGRCTARRVAELAVGADGAGEPSTARASGRLAFSADGALVASAIGRGGRARRSGTWRRARSSPPSRLVAGGRTPSICRRAQPRGTSARRRRIREARSRLGRRRREARPRARAQGCGRETLEFSHDGASSPSPASSRSGVPLGRGDGTQIGPNLTAGQPHGDDRPVVRRAPPAADARERRRRRLGHRPEGVGAPRVRARQPHIDAGGVGAIPPRPALRAGLREPEGRSTT